MPSNKDVDRLEKILSAFMEVGVRPEELIQAIDTVMGVISASEKSLTSKLEQKGQITESRIRSIEQDTIKALSAIQSLIKETRDNNNLDITYIKDLVASEVKRLEEAIPETPEGYDDSEIKEHLAEHKALLNSVQGLLMAENIRNALEVLPDGEKLAMSAIEGLEEALAKRIERTRQTTALIAHRLDQIGDVSIAGVTDGQVLAYNATTGLWEAADQTGSGSGHAIEDEGTPLTQRDTLNFVGAGVTVTDAGGKTVVTIPGGGGGGAVDSVNGQTGVVVLDADDIDDTSTTHKFTTASDISKLAGIEAGAEVNNISDVNATDLTDGGTTTLHNHDSRYYTETETDTLLSGKANTSHTHAISDVTGLQTALDGKAATSHTHTASQVTDFNESVEDIIGTKVVAGTNVTVSYNDTTGETTINSSGGAGYTDEQAQDAVGTILVDSSEIDFTYNDATPSITASIVAGSIDESKLDTSVNASLDLADSASQPGHTHSIANVTGLQTALDGKLDDFVVVSGSLTASNDTLYNNVATATYTDPSPTEGKGFVVFVRNGTATVGGTGYSTAGTIINRIYHSGAWANYEYQVASTFALASHTHTLSQVSDVTMTVSNLNSLDDGADSTLHFHATDRARANHTGTQLASTVSDFNEAAQDAVGGMVDTTLVYSDATPSLSRAALTGAITASAGSNTTALGSFTKSQLDGAVSDGNVLYVGDVTTNATHTGEVTGSGALTVDKTAITNKTLVTAAVGDHILVADASDTDNLKKVTVQTIVDLAGGGGNTFNDIYTDQSGGTSDTYGVLSGSINGSNALFTVSQSVYATGTLQVWLNGQLQTQGSGQDWVETTPASGTFTFATAPLTGDEITVTYQKVVTNSDTIVTTADYQSAVVRVIHGATAGTSRPAGATYVEWVGSVEPTNATNNDTWVETP